MILEHYVTDRGTNATASEKTECLTLLCNSIGEIIFLLFKITLRQIGFYLQLKGTQVVPIYKFSMLHIN